MKGKILTFKNPEGKIMTYRGRKGPNFSRWTEFSDEELRDLKWLIRSSKIEGDCYKTTNDFKERLLSEIQEDIDRRKSEKQDNTKKREKVIPISRWLGFTYDELYYIFWMVKKSPIEGEHYKQMDNRKATILEDLEKKMKSLETKNDPGIDIAKK